MTNAEGFQQQLEQRQQEEEALAKSLKESAYVDYYVSRDRDARWYGTRTSHDTAPDGRPLMIGTKPYDEYCAPKGVDKI